MTTSKAKKQPTKELQTVSTNDKLMFTQEEVALIKAQIAPQATDNELKIFLHQCKRTGLDPLSRQIYCIHRGGKMTIQTSIDGFRAIAERSGSYAGQDEPEFVYDDKKKLICCKVNVYRFTKNETRYKASVGVAFWNEYAGQNLWLKMPHTMLSKVAEALALRKAFPQDLGGLYTSDEMQQAEQEQQNETQKQVFEEKPQYVEAEEVKEPTTEQGFLSEAGLRIALNRIKSGQLDVYDKCKSHFKLTEDQEEKLLRTYTAAKATELNNQTQNTN